MIRDPILEKLMSIINCQQQDILKIKDGIPSHGPQIAKFRYRPLHSGFEYVRLACGCALPISWLPLRERQDVLQNVPKSGETDV